MLIGQGRKNNFLLLGQVAPLPFFSLSSLPLPSRFPPLPIQSCRSRPLLLPFPIPSISFSVADLEGGRTGSAPPPWAMD